MESAEILADEDHPLPTGIPIKDRVVEELAKKLRMMMALKYCKEDNVPNEVIPGLFIGSIGSALNKPVLKDLGITHVLCVADKINPAFPTDFIYKAIRILDSPEVNLQPYLQECYDFICYGLAAGKILVHCFAGKSRSASVIVAFLMRVNHWTFDEALAHLREKRPVVDPNPGFVNQLKSLPQLAFS